MSETMKVLIAYDGSDGANAALDDLRYAGLPDVGEAVVMSVAEVFLPPGSSPPSDPVPLAVRQAWARANQVLEEARVLAQQACERLQSILPGWNVQPEACADAPAWAVIKKADSWKPNLIVVGSEGRSAIGRLVLGSVSQKILAEASCSVRIGRRRPHENTTLNLLIGIDYSPDAANAVQVVNKRTWPAGTAVHLVTVLDAKLSTGAFFGPLTPQPAAKPGDEDLGSRISAMMDNAAAPLRARALKLSQVIDDGDPKHVLLEEAEQHRTDCIFVGARGLRGVKRFLLGSVSSAVAARAKCSVEIVR